MPGPGELTYWKRGHAAHRGALERVEQVALASLALDSRVEHLCAKVRRHGAVADADHVRALLRQGDMVTFHGRDDEHLGTIHPDEVD